MSDALELVRLRNNFYRDNYRKLLLAMLISLVVIASLVGMLFYMHATQPTPKYFATTEDGRIIPLVPLNEPMLSDNALLQWVSLAATSSYTFDFLHWRKQLQGVEKYFTPSGYQQYLDAWKKANNLEAVIKRKLTVSAVATGTPVIQAKGLLGNRYGWRVQMPMVVTFQSASEQSTQNLLVTVTVVRRSTLITPQGIGIANFVTTPR